MFLAETIYTVISNNRKEGIGDPDLEKLMNNPVAEYMLQDYLPFEIGNWNKKKNFASAEAETECGS